MVMRHSASVIIITMHQYAKTEATRVTNVRDMIKLMKGSGCSADARAKKMPHSETIKAVVAMIASVWRHLLGACILSTITS
jgi:hypothetical protein